MPDYSLADIAAATGNGGGGNGNNGNNGFGDGSGWWILLLFILLGGFGGNRGWGGNGGSGAGSVGGNELYPWLNQANQMNDGFRDQMINGTINGIQQGVNSLATQLCNCCCDMQMALANGFAGVNSNLCNGFNQTQVGMLNGFNGTNMALLEGFNNIEQGANTRQMANMQQAFAAQTAMMQGFNALQAQQADCCCENRLAVANLNSTILAENCADRAALSDGIRDVIANQTANTQRIVDNDNANYRQIFDWLCQKELRDEQRENANLRQQLQMADLRASQIQQTAQIQAGQVAEVEALYNRLRDCPVGTMPVYGNQPIFTCQPQYSSCGCNNGCGCN